VWSLLAVSLIPVIIGAIVMIRRHRRTRLPRNVAG
jgi:heme exporter protein D